jgi:hypothetical protein
MEKGFPLGKSCRWSDRRTVEDYQGKAGRSASAPRTGNFGVGSFLVSSSTSGSGSAQSPTVPTWQWKNSWKDKAQDELTEAQRLARQLIDLVERKDVAQGTLKRTMDALRKARQQEPELQRQLAEARRELREGLTPRQEAALVLMRWL